MTYQEYMEARTGKTRDEQRALHHQYYKQFVTPSIIQAVVPSLGRALKQSTDPHYNDISLKSWDLIAKGFTRHVCAVNKRLNGSYSWSPAIGVCMLKAAAREWLKQEAEKDAAAREWLKQEAEKEEV